MRILPLFSMRWMFGWVTPKRSIRLRSTLKELSMALFASLRMTSMTSLSVDSGFTLSRSS